MSFKINVIDLFAGPGGLGEGFSSFVPAGRKSPSFKIRMSVEKDQSAHRTLSLRALYRNLQGSREADLYHHYLSGEISIGELQEASGEAWKEADHETLYGPKALGEDNQEIHDQLQAFAGENSEAPWVVIGGPPCQAYSLAGRSRNKGIAGYKAEADARHFLYQEYLEVLARIEPEVFVMENVKGILTSKVGGERIFSSIKEDLKNPAKATGKTGRKKEYRIYSFVIPPDQQDLLESSYSNDTDYVIRAESFGIPQARHRVILLGISSDIRREPSFLDHAEQVNIEHVLGKLPPLRSKLSRGLDSSEYWRQAICDQAERTAKEIKKHPSTRNLAERILERAGQLKSTRATISKKRPQEPFSRKLSNELRDWLNHDPPSLLLNHETRGHIPADLGRYFFSACWAEEHSRLDTPIPKASDFPKCLAPSHANWESGHFADRFRVQRKGRPATTITSHIAKDGHYFIHYDPTQCRALTVREAARIQTFPDNYFFEGNRTQQYVQVGNAVPPFLAKKLAKIVYELVS